MPNTEPVAKPHQSNWHLCRLSCITLCTTMQGKRSPNCIEVDCEGPSTSTTTSYAPYRLTSILSKMSIKIFHNVITRKLTNFYNTSSSLISLKNHKFEIQKLHTRLHGHAIFGVVSVSDTGTGTTRRIPVSGECPLFFFFFRFSDTRRRGADTAPT